MYEPLCITCRGAGSIPKGFREKPARSVVVKMLKGFHVRLPAPEVGAQSGKSRRGLERRKEDACKKACGMPSGKFNMLTNEPWAAMRLGEFELSLVL
jgi:hypothetical protein